MLDITTRVEIVDLYLVAASKSRLINEFVLSHYSA